MHFPLQAISIFIIIRLPFPTKYTNSGVRYLDIYLILVILNSITYSFHLVQDILVRTTCIIKLQDNVYVLVK